MPTIWAGVRLAGAWEGVVLETAITRVSSANGKACSPPPTSLVLSGEDERAKSTSGLFVPPYSRDLPAPEPFGRVVAALLGSAMVPPPVAAKVAIRSDGAGVAAFHLSAKSLRACWLVSEPTPIRSAPVGVKVVSSGSTAADAE